MYKPIRVKKCDIDFDMDVDYDVYKLSNLWINSRLKKSLDMAACKGTPLFDLKKSNFLWKKYPNRVNTLFKEYYRTYFDMERPPYIEYDYRYYIIKNVYGWAVPSQNDIDKILKYSEDKIILDLGCGTGYWSRILSFYKKVLPVDIKKESCSFDFEYIDIIEEDARDVFRDNNGQFVILNYPRNDVIVDVFKEAKIGTRFFINIPFIAAGFGVGVIDWIVSSSKILDYSSSWLGNSIDKYDGVFLEKRKDAPLNGGVMEDLVNDIRNAKVNWKNYRKAKIHFNRRH